MNIIVAKKRAPHFYMRGDNTLIRALSDFFIPDFVSSVEAVPVLIFRIDRPGRMISKEFAGRYLGKFGFGVLLNCRFTDEIENRGDAESLRNMLDYTSLIPNYLYEKEKYADLLCSQGDELLLSVNGKVVFSTRQLPPMESVATLFCNISSFASVRTGDIFAVELSDPVTIERERRLKLSQGGLIHTDVIVR